MVDGKVVENMKNLSLEIFEPRDESSDGMFMDVTVMQPNETGLMEKKRLTLAGSEEEMAKVDVAKYMKKMSDFRNG